MDTNFVEKVAKFVEQMSRKSQIFMTTFKPQMASVRDASYFMVSIPENEEVSRVGVIDQKTAQTFLSAEK